MSGALVDPRVRIPVAINQGDTVSWLDDPFSDTDGGTYASDAFALTYKLAAQQGGSGTPLIVAAVAQGRGWLMTLSSANTAGLAAGINVYQAVLTGTSFQRTVARGELVVMLDVGSVGANTDLRSQAEQTLADLKVALAALCGSNGQKPVAMYRIGTREMTYQSIPSILKAISYWQTVVNDEQNTNSIAQGQGNRRKTYFRFPGGFGGRE